ncbi:trypsin-like peptidase domain-containing protein [Streptomyces sp. DSM 3412]|uniref:Trypsin-like peptidase domain-containing protein n=1 Tax=Streptomyces gottesmaniae TaxID=3075518 RepID=A0ABU2YQC9_9ACTN|nr:trypsin-like peptidase domain-containing protein [Streptomyces sp. DSM 3412]MDT0566529.1 trypsin-like peptidase domain-containing protein [Streptomyces sp. DSM 3412]
MDEGKPTKAKWWSRPRAHGAGAETSGDHIGATAADGPENPEGDFELERPAATVTVPALDESDPRTESESETEAGIEADSDFELARPVVRVPPGTALMPTADAAGDTDGDFELERPAVRNAGHDPEGATSSPTGPDGVGTGGATAAATAATSAHATVAAAPATTVVGVPSVADGRPSGEEGALSAPDAPSERRRPLHDPDPYSTPPYGEPGPWAPAPPVQHPATTPVPGTNVQPTTAAPDVRAVPGASALDGATATEVLSGGGAASAASSTHAGAPAAAAHEYAHPTTPVTPAHGTAVPAAAPRAAAPSYEQVSVAAAAAPFPDTAQPTATLHPDASQPAGASYAYPSQPGPAPFGDSARSVPPPYAGGAQPVPPSQGAGGRHPSGAHADPGRPTHGSQGPWQNYDPWAGSGPLQQNGAAVDDVARRRRRRGRTLLVGALLIAVVAGGVGGAVGVYLERNGGVGAIELPQTSEGVTGRAPDSVAGIAASALPSVVTLHVSGDSAQGTGTGFVLDERGHILTNNHVVDPAGTGGDISVTFSGGETAEASIVGRDTGYDLAVVKVSGVSGLKPLPLGNSEEVQVGDPVVAIGAPFDLANTVTSGIISAKERPITAGGESGDVSDVSYVDALQTDAPINPGNSGGPLLDGKARVIGINSAIRSAGSGSESDGGQAGSIGLGFAIPINQGKRVAEELINTGKATHPVIGVTLDMDYSGDGARIGDRGDGNGSGVTSGGPADRAGMRSGDVITEVDGQRVHSGDELIVKVRAHRPGDRLELTLLRDGKERTVSLTLGSSGGD